MKKISTQFIVTIALIFTLCLSCSAGTQLTGNATHTSSMHPNAKFSLTGYLYYSNNTRDSITCDKLGFSVKNIGTTSLDTAVFHAFNGNGTGNNKETIGDYYNDPTFDRLEPGKLVLHTTPPWGKAVNVSSVYMKKEKNAIFEMGVGPTEYDCASHQVWSYPDLSFKTRP